MPHDHATLHTQPPHTHPESSALATRAMHVEMQLAGSAHAESALVHLQYADDPTPAYLSQPAASIPVTHLHLASVSPVSVARIEPGAGMIVQRSESVASAAAAGGGAAAGVRLLWRPADPSAAFSSSAAGLPRSSSLSPPHPLAASSSSSSHSDAAHRSELIRSLLFDAQQEDQSTTDAAVVTPAPSYINASTSLVQAAPTELPDLASLSSMHGSSLLPPSSLSLPARSLPLPMLDELPSIRALVSDASVLPDSLPSEQPLPPWEPSTSPPVAAAEPAATSNPSPEPPPPVFLPMPAEWSPSDPATTDMSSSPPVPVALAAAPQHKSPAEEKQAEAEGRPAAGARPVPSPLFRFQTPPLPASAPIARAFTASAGASPYRGSINSLFKPSAAAASTLILSRRGSTGRPTSRATHRAPGSAEAISPSRGNAFPVPPPSVSMLRQRSQLSSQQAAAAGITPFRTALNHACSTGSASNLLSYSNPPSAAASPMGLGARFLPAAASAGSVSHPFIDAAAVSVDAQTHLSLVKAQLDEHVEMRLREVRRELEDMVATQMAHYTAMVAASTAASSSVGSTRISPFHAPPTPLSANAAASASGVHPFADAPRPSHQSALLASPRPSPSPARHTTPGPSFAASSGSGPIAMPRPTSHGPTARLLLSPRPATAGSSATGLPVSARSPRPQSFLFGAATTTTGSM